MLTYKPIDYRDLPEIALYMDQVLGYLDQQLAVFRSADEENILTKTMINNYVKAGLIPKPVKKKYTPDHLASLIMIYFLKNVVPMQTIEALTDPPGETEALYARFNEIQQRVLDETEERFSGREKDRALALELLIRADILKRQAEMIVKEL